MSWFFLTCCRFSWWQSWWCCWCRRCTLTWWWIWCWCTLTLPTRRVQHSLGSETHCYNPPPIRFVFIHQLILLSGHSTCQDSIISKVRLRWFDERNCGCWRLALCGGECTEVAAQLVVAQISCPLPSNNLTCTKLQVVRLPDSGTCPALTEQRPAVT